MSADRLRDERGFTLIELLMASLIGLIVLGAAFNLLDATFRGQRRAENRMDAASQGRLAMDHITRQLRSQVCLGKGIAPMLEATDTRTTFYASLAPERTDPSAAPTVQKRTLEYVDVGGGRGKIVQTVINGTGTLPNVTFSGAGTTTILASNIAPVSGKPVFRYYKYDPDLSPNVQKLTPPIDDANRQIIVQVQTAFDAFPTNSVDADKVKVTLDSKVTVRTADPTDPTRSPKCI